MAAPGAVLSSRRTPATNPLLDRYTAAAAAAGCPIDQITNFVRAGIVLQGPQLTASAIARQCDDEGGPTQVGFGGSRGGGKSYWLLAQMGADDCQRFAGLKCLLLRKVGKAGIENFDDLRRRLLMGIPHEYSQKGILTFANGSRIIAGHYQHEKDIDSYLGLEYDTIGIEEATTLSVTKYRDVRTCNRSSKPGWRPRTYSTTNPGGVGHAYYKSLFIDPWRKRSETNTRFIFARATDNVFNNSEYVSENLESLTGWKRRAWLDGDWDIAAGQFFTNWHRDIHVLPSQPPGSLPRNWSYWIAMDYGFTHYTVVHLGAADSDGNIYVLDEHAERRWLPQRHAEAILGMLERHGLTITGLDAFVAGADVFQVGKSETGKTIAQTYRELLGRMPTAANDDRVNGAGEMLARLGDRDAVDSDGKPAPIPPRLFVYDRCQRLIDGMPAMEHNPNRPEDILKWDTDDEGNGGDDAVECARYLCMAKYRHRKKYTPQVF